VRKRNRTIWLQRSLPLLACFGFVRQAGAGAHSFTWNVDANGSWDTASNWTPHGVPGGNSGDTVTFDGAITADRTITLGAEQAKAVTFDSTHAYTLTGSSLALGNGDVNTILTQSGSGAVNMNVPVILNAGNDGSTFTGSGSGTVTFNNRISGDGPLTVSGSHITTFASGNSFTGGLTVDGATLQLTAAGSASSGDVVVQNGGTLLLGGSSSTTSRLGSSVNLTLSGSTLNTAGMSENIGKLTLLCDSSSINLGSGSSVLKFADSHSVSWSSGSTLTIYNWSGSTHGGGSDQLYFGTTTSGLTSAQLGEIVFSNPAGFALAGNYPAAILADGEIVPVPEPATYVAAGCLLALAVYRERKTILDFVGRARGRSQIS